MHVHVEEDVVESCVRLMVAYIGSTGSVVSAGATEPDAGAVPAGAVTEPLAADADAGVGVVTVVTTA